jgi:hypothetical protein
LLVVGNVEERMSCVIVHHAKTIRVPFYDGDCDGIWISGNAGDLGLTFHGRFEVDANKGHPSADVPVLRETIFLYADAAVKS